MTGVRLLTSVAILCLSSAALAATNIKPARTAAEGWLTKLDAGRYEDTHREAAAFFRTRVTAKGWAAMIGAARGPFGKFVRRDFGSAEETTTAPGAPDGHYVILHYKAVFERKKAAMETITTMLEKDHKWRVAGYFVK